MIAWGSPARLILGQSQLLLFLAVQAGWLYAWSALLGVWLPWQGVAPVLSLAWVVGLLLGATASTRLAASRRKPTLPARAAIALLGALVALLVGIVSLRAGQPAAAGSAIWVAFSATNLGLRSSSAALLALLTWWRGIVVGRSSLSLDEVESGFRTSLLWLAAALVASTVPSPGREAANLPLLLAVIVVLFAGLTGLPLARIDELSRASRRRGAAALGIRGEWLATFIGTVVALLFFTLVLSGVLTFERVDSVLRLVAGPADALLTIIVYAIAVPMGFLIEGLIYLIRLLLHPGAPRQPPRMPNLNPLQALRNQAAPGAGPSPLIELLLRWTAGAVVAALVVIILARAVSRVVAWSSDDDVEEERDFVWSWALLRDEARLLLRSLFRSRQTAAVAAPVERAPPEIDRRLWGVREIYREFLRMGMQHGRARMASETPAEYERAIVTAGLFASGESDVETLTDIYERDRYGEVAPDQEAILAARLALERLLEPPDRDQLDH